MTSQEHISDDNFETQIEFGEQKPGVKELAKEQRKRAALIGRAIEISELNAKKADAFVETLKVMTTEDIEKKLVSMQEHYLEKKEK